MSTFDWNTGEPSIFCTASALRYSRASATSSANVSAQQAKKKRVVPDIKTRKKRKVVAAPRSGRPQILIDLDAVRTMLQAGKTQQQCATHFDVAVDTIRSRLGTKKPRIRAGSSFNTPIATRAQSDRTNSIAGRV